MPRYLCFWQVIKRRFQYAKRTRPDLPQGCREKLSIAYILKVLVFPHRGRNLLLEKIAEIRKYEAKEPELVKKNIHTCCSKEEVDAFLQELAALRQEAHTHEENRQSQKSVPTLVEV
jgi:adenylate kinase family enzyme